MIPATLKRIGNACLFAVIASLSALTSLHAETAAPVNAKNLLTNGDFSKASKDEKMPDNWSWDPAAPVTWETEDGKHFLRLVSQQPGQLVQVVQAAPLPPDAKGLELSALYRMANFKFGANYVKDIRLMFEFQDAGGTPIPKANGGFVMDSHAKTWTDTSRRFLVPEGAAKVAIKPTINQAASGTLDLKEVRLVALSPEEATAMADAETAKKEKKEAASAGMMKKRAEDEVLVQQILLLPPTTKELKVSGNKLVTADGTAVWLQGVNVPSLGWSGKGENVLQSIKVAIDEWKANVIRLPVNDSLWFGRGRAPETSNDAEAYRQVVDNAVKVAAARGAYIVLDLHRFSAPEDRDVEFWKDAAARYKNNPAVLFDIFNEPDGVSWEVWRNGGEVKAKQKDKKEPRVFQSPGMQGLIEAVRATGAKNIIVAGGLGHAYDLSGILNGYALEDKTGNGIMYATHFYNWHRGWQKNFLDLVDKYPILIGETGADVKKMPFVKSESQEDPMTWVPDMLAMVQKHRLNWTGFSMHPTCTPVMITNWTFEPTPFWGQFAKDALAGKKFESEKIR